MDSPASAAAKWWAERLRDGAGIGNNGSADPSSVMAGFMVSILRDRHPPTTENCAAFERLLAAAIARALNERDPICYYDSSGFDDGGPCLALSVDYNPDRLLYACLIEAGVHESIASMSALPLKTRMRISARRVLVSHGYGKQLSELWGPAWGCTIAEQAAADLYRSEASEIAESAWLDAPAPRWRQQEWKGCVP